MQGQPHAGKWGAARTPRVRRGQQPGGSYNSSSRENSSVWENHQHPAPPGPELGPGAVPRAARAGGRSRSTAKGAGSGKSVRALPARASSRDPAGKAGAALSRAGTVPVPAPARARAPWHGPGSGPAPAPSRVRSATGTRGRPRRDLGDPWHGGQAGYGRQRPGMGRAGNCRVNRNVCSCAPATCRR